MGRAVFGSTESVAYFFRTGLRTGRFAADITLRPIGLLAGFLPDVFFRAAGFIETDFATAALLDFLLALLDDFFALGGGLAGIGEKSDAIGVVTFTAPFLFLTTDAATAIRRAYFFFIAILVDIVDSCFSPRGRVIRFGRALI